VNIVFCADRRVLPGLHVAAYSLLHQISPAVPATHFYLFSDELDEADAAFLEQTLRATGKKFSLALRRIDPKLFAHFPSLNGSHATYYRLMAPETLPLERFLYVDADTLCDVDVSELGQLDMNGFAAGWVPEAPLPGAVDRGVAEQLGNRPDDFYFNAGVMLINAEQWRRQKITEKAMACLRAHPPAFWDQSALNLVLHRQALVLDSKFNCIANMRRNWPSLRQPYGQVGRLVHFLDYPKPWDFLGEWLHPQYQLWRTVLNQTAANDFRSWHRTPARKIPRTAKAREGYKKALKDRLLFAGYARGWFKQVKGVPTG
jgi:lipopolysaccharide biosynthesis glycosyltransferase